MSINSTKTQAVAAEGSGDHPPTPAVILSFTSNSCLPCSTALFEREAME